MPQPAGKTDEKKEGMMEEELNMVLILLLFDFSPPANGNFYHQNSMD